MNRITGLLSRAIEEVHMDVSRMSTTTSEELSKRRSDDSSECEEIAEVFETLQRGYLVLKLSDRSDSAKPKFIYTSKDNRSLCWKSVDKED